MGTLRAAQRIAVTPDGDAEQKYWAAGTARPYALPRQGRGEAAERFPAEVPARPRDGSRGGPRLTAREASAVLGVSQQDLAALVDDGVLCPVGPDQPGARRFPASEVEAVLNGTAEPAQVVPITRQALTGQAAPAIPRRAGHGPRTGLAGPAGLGGPVAERSRDRRPAPPPPRPRRGASRPADGAAAGLAAAKAEPGHKAQARYLRALARAIVAEVGPGADCELRWQQEHPFLPYLRVRDTSVWTVSTSSGWRFLWNRYRSHPAADAAGAAQVIAAELSLRDDSGPDRGPGQPLG